VVGALGYWFILILPYKSITKRSYQLQMPKDILSYTKYNYHIISWCYSEDIYSNDSLLGAMKGKFYTIKQLWRLCQSLYCFRPASASSIHLCLVLFPTLFLYLYCCNILCVLFLMVMRIVDLPATLPIIRGFFDKKNPLSEPPIMRTNKSCFRICE
jgi:hypothetical protein